MFLNVIVVLHLNRNDALQWKRVMKTRSTTTMMLLQICTTVWRDWYFIVFKVTLEELWSLSPRTTLTQCAPSLECKCRVKTDTLHCGLIITRPIHSSISTFAVALNGAIASYSESCYNDARLNYTAHWSPTQPKQSKASRFLTLQVTTSIKFFCCHNFERICSSPFNDLLPVSMCPAFCTFLCVTNC